MAHRIHKQEDLLGIRARLRARVRDRIGVEGCVGSLCGETATKPVTTMDSAAKIWANWTSAESAMIESRMQERMMPGHAEARTCERDAGPGPAGRLLQAGVLEAGVLEAGVAYTAGSRAALPASTRAP